MKKMNTVYLITGGNIGNRKANLERAASEIELAIGQIVASSQIYETAAWGITEQPAFYNQVQVVNTSLSAVEVLDKILAIEKIMGRIRTIKNAARIIDIDILFYNNEVIHEPNLEIPHPEISNRRFVLEPLKELSPDLMHPVLHKTISELWADCKDPLPVHVLTD
jgi:2-amino-4-hydroxy-6-hydroxymethyldihydropteridine diphosphokinase